MSFADKFKEKLSKLTDTQESIQTLSHWVRMYSKNISIAVSIWKEELVNSQSPERRLLLLYLSNDIAQESKRKNDDIVNELQKVLADPLVDTWRMSPEFIQTKIERLVKIWDERKIFAPQFFQSVSSKINPSSSSTTVTPTTQAVVQKSAEKVDNALLNLTELDATGLQDRIVSFADYTKLIESTKSMADNLTHSTSLYDKLHEKEEKVRSAVPDCLKLSPQLLAHIRNKDIEALKSQRSTIDSTRSLIYEYIAHLQSDLEINQLLISSLNSVIAERNIHMNKVKESIRVSNYLLETSQVLQQKLSQKIPGDSNTNTIVPDEQSSVTTEVAKNLKRTIDEHKSTNTGNSGVLDLSEYKKRKLNNEDKESHSYSSPQAPLPSSPQPPPSSPSLPDNDNPPSSPRLVD
eukprot:TRINITY_DN4550_c2_g2_i1.p1 TRINITY_DN4550_c2_g2~~TRINITY_DN4550_c2_g2_i1.p1  ORF type:complete len:406 (+),score=54.52 TRINITY_DN4550_c2_g2_i1:36-1253(+)